MTIDVVTGGAGFIGSHLVDHLMETTDHDVLVIDNFSRGTLSNLQRHRDAARLTALNIDITETAVLCKVTQGADRIFHLAGLADIVPSIDNPLAYYDTNVSGTLSVLEVVRANQIKKLVYMASSSCYGIADTYPTPEDEPISTLYPYALTKWMGEELVQHWAVVYGVPAVTARLFNAYGPRSATKGAYGAVWGVFMAQMLADAPLTVIGTGEQRRDFVFVTDVAEALCVLADKGEVGEAYNVGSGGPVSINQLIEELDYHKVINLPPRPGEPEITWADISKIQALGWQPKVPFRRGVKIMLEHKDDYRNAPVWTPAGVEAATQMWTECLA